MSGLEKSDNNMSNKQTEQVVPRVEKKQGATTSSADEGSSNPVPDAAIVTGDVTELEDDLRSLGLDGFSDVVPKGKTTVLPIPVSTLSGYCGLGSRLFSTAEQL